MKIMMIKLDNSAVLFGNLNQQRGESLSFTTDSSLERTTLQEVIYGHFWNQKSQS
jgi:hypothetical protein